MNSEYPRGWLKIVMSIIFLILFSSPYLFAAQGDTDAVSWGMITGLFGGLALFLYGMGKMSDGMEPLRAYPGFINAMKNLENPLLGIRLETLFAAFVQSRSATTGVVIVLAGQGLIGIESGIPIIFGANIGTCVTAGLASINTSREAGRVALAHVLFKIAPDSSSLINRDAVLRMAFTSTMPSIIPLSLRHSSTCEVMLIKARRVGTLNQHSFR